MKKGLVMEGGAMRGMFTAGVTDVFLENNICFDGAVGVSAGAVFGCNFKSRQKGRAIRYNKRFCNDKRYCSLSSLIKTGDLYNAKFDYDTLPNELDKFDYDAFEQNPMDFYVVATDADTGSPVYHKCTDGRGVDMEWMRASASMPALSNLVHIEGLKLSDGGTSDSVPFQFLKDKGYEKIVVICTQPKGYRKEKNKMLPFLRLALRKSPALLEALNTRHLMYNRTMDELDKAEESGELLIIRPSVSLNIKPGEKNPEELERVYQEGVRVGKAMLNKVIEFLKD